MLARWHNFLVKFHRNRNGSKMTSKQIVVFSIAILVQISEEWRGGGVTVRISAQLL